MNYEEIHTQELEYFLKQFNSSISFTIETSTGSKLTFNVESQLSKSIRKTIEKALVKAK